MNKSQLYMVLNVTTNENTKLHFVAERSKAIALGKIYQLEHPGQKVIAPPLEGRSFSKLDKLQLQWLYWNMTEITPPDEYSVLLKACLEYVKKLEPISVDLSVLQGTLAQLESVREKTIAPYDASLNSKPARPKKEKATDVAPKKTSTCGYVWNICDKHKAETPEADDKTLRAAIMAECEHEGINKSTAAVQYGKWKSSLK